MSPARAACRIAGIVVAVALGTSCGGTPRDTASVAPIEPSPTSRVPLALTIDDLPFVGPVASGDSKPEAIRRIIAAARERDAPVAGFATCGNVFDRGRALATWIDAGITVGNHSTAHRSLDALGLEAWRDDLVSCQTRLEELSDEPVTLFRYPMLQTGRERALRDAGFAALDDLGLRRAPVTIDTAEWALARPYVAALDAGDTELAAAIAATYVDHVRRAARRYASLAAELGHAEAPQILLLHANALAADHLGRLLDALRADGFAFVDLDTALADPLYARNDHYVGPIGLSWLYRIEEERDGAPRWAWDAAQHHAMQVRFGGAEERESFDLDRGLAIERVEERSYVVRDAVGSAATRVEVQNDGRVRVTDPPRDTRLRQSLADWIATRFEEPGTATTFRN